MRKIQVKTADGWAWVFCAFEGNQIMTTPNKAQALPSKAIWAQDDLEHFQRKFCGEQFRLAASL